MKGNFLVNSASTVDFIEIESSSPATVTVFYDESDTKRVKNAFSLPRTTLAGVGLAFLLSFAPSTTMIDPWVMERKRRDAVVTMSIYNEVIGRTITRTEALRIASQILIRAEQERFAYAEIEAARGIQWG